ncbi:MAG: hypothetical protein ACRD0I_07440 [Acidimicrobiales bacterium]
MAAMEILTFRLGVAMDETDFLALDRRVQTEFIPNHAGFLRRTTMRSASGEWAVVSLWRSEDDAVSSARLGADDGLFHQFMASMEPGTVDRRTYDTLD